MMNALVRGAGGLIARPVSAAAYPAESVLLQQARARKAAAAPPATSHALHSRRFTSRMSSYFSPSNSLVGTRSSPFGVRAFSTQVAGEGYYNAEEQKHYLRADSSNGDPSKRAFTYLVFSAARFTYSAAIRLIILKFIYSMSASADVLALSTAEVDISGIEEGSQVTIKWRGKPVFIRHRSEEDIKAARTVDMKDLKDPQADEDRVVNPDWLVLIGVCTHLGCVPLSDAGDFHAYFCPCHGSHYDSSGRIRKGPAPANLVVPPYKFLSDETLLIG